MNLDRARPIRAVVAFVGASELRWLRRLKPGFRHCFVALNDGAGWIALDPLSGRTEVHALPLPAEADVAAWYEAQGHICVRLSLPALPARASGLRWLWVPCTCVGQVQRVLGLGGLALTPWRLYRRLRTVAAKQQI